jgi:UPF0042 nucleotide-binding protein
MTAETTGVRTPAPARVILVTGLSGAGKTSALKAFEDLGFECIDNVPLSLLAALVGGDTDKTGDGDDARKPLAVGIDIRTRDFGAQAFADELAHLKADTGGRTRMLFMDCDDDELKRRYAETRHRHPLAQDRPIGDGIAHERRLMAPLRDSADVVLDTTSFGPGEMKSILNGHFGAEADAGLTLFVMSFGFKKGLPREADLVFDVRFLANPHYDPDLKSLTGRDGAVADYVEADPGFQPFFDGLTALLAPLLPRYAQEGKSYLTVALGCTGGRHRSVFTAERLRAWLEDRDERVHLRHRDL